jgi:hypothetical protein
MSAWGKENKKGKCTVLNKQESMMTCSMHKGQAYRYAASFSVENKKIFRCFDLIDRG